MKKSIVRACVFALLLILGLCGCEKKSGEAVVIGKDYVAAAKQGEEIKDERATNNEQWIVKIRMLDNGRKIQVRVDRAQWEEIARKRSSQSRVSHRQVYRNDGMPRSSKRSGRSRLAVSRRLRG